MFCKKCILVNWGNIPHLEFDFGPVNLFSGGSGSGKTTAADALQSIMTAAHENLFTYNPGQDETTQRGRGGKQVRTLASYILGCDDGSYARPKTIDGYIAASFHPTKGESGEKFTAVMCVRASLDTAGSSRQARQEEILFLIIPNEDLQLEDFVHQHKDGKKIILLSEITNSLGNKYGKNVIESYDKKGPYLRRLYGAMRGQKNAVSDREAKHAAKTFSNFMAYKPVKSINEFVAREVLEPKDLSEDIKQVSELMKTIHYMEEETRQVKESIAKLEHADELANQYIQGWTDKCVGEYTETTRLLILQQQDYLQAKNDQRKNQESIEDTSNRLSSNDNKKSLLHDQLISLEAKRQGIDALKDKDQLGKDIESLKTQLANQARPLLEQNHQFSENHTYAENLQSKLKEFSLGVEVPALDQKSFGKTLSSVVVAGKDTGIDAQKLFNADWVGISDLEHRLDKLVDLELIHRELAGLLHESERTLEKISIRDQVLAVVNRRKDQQVKIGQQVILKQQEIQKLENHNNSYPHYVEQAVQAILSLCPEAKPCVLCDFVEVVDQKWQMAIEGYIGGKRFSIIVEPEYEAEAIRIVRGIKGRKNNASIIQGAKAQRDAVRLNIPKNSIIELMQFEHKIVEYYLTATYGNVVQVSNEDELKQTARGITANGLGSGGYSMFRCDIDDAELVFGQGARERALRAKQTQLDSLREQSNQCQRDHRHAAYAYGTIEKIKTIQCADIVKNMLDLYRECEKTESQLANLDLSDFTQLEESLQTIKEEFVSAEQEGKLLQRTIGELNSITNQFTRNIKELADKADEIQELQEIHEGAIQNITKVYPDFDVETALHRADEQAKSANIGFSFASQNYDYLTQMDRNERALHDVIMTHNQEASTYTSIMYNTDTGERNDAQFFKSIFNIKKQVEAVYHSMKNNVLVDKHEKITVLKDSFNTAFVTNLCHSIYQSINDGKRILDDLNKELEHHRFGADQERFYFGYQWVPEFHEYQRFFKEVINIPNLGDGSTLFDADLSEKSCVVRDKLLSMLLDKDDEMAQRELARLSDYRHYREYEIYKQPLNKQPIALSRYGTGSGGQLETPAYIIRSAAVTSAFRFNEGNTHCRMVMVDEAFSKMDEPRSREVINYLTKTLGLQLIFIMPTSKSGPFIDLISNQIVFSKCPTEEKIGELNTRVLVDRKICNQDKIAELWANHRITVRHQGSLDFMEEFV